MLSNGQIGKFNLTSSDSKFSWILIKTASCLYITFTQQMLLTKEMTYNVLRLSDHVTKSSHPRQHVIYYLRLKNGNDLLLLPHSLHSVRNNHLSATPLFCSLLSHQIESTEQSTFTESVAYQKARLHEIICMVAMKSQMSSIVGAS